MVSQSLVPWLVNTPRAPGAELFVTVMDNKINFFIYYEVDGDTSKHHLRARATIYIGYIRPRENECGCVLLVPAQCDRVSVG